jgi:DNA replication initiation complex subunit (GINS family)
MISYNEIYEAARKERYSEQLQPIQKNFISEVSKYLKEKKELVAAEGEFSDNVLKVKKQLENAITLFKELVIRRRKKILNLVLIASETGISKQDFENMLAIEKELFEDLMKVTESSDKKLSGLLSSGEGEPEAKNEMVVFLNNVGEFLGLSGEMMGPFDKGQIANLPKEIVKILLEGKKVEVVEK